MEVMANDHHTKRRPRSRSLTIFSAVSGVLSLITFVFALYNLIEMKNVQVEIKVLQRSIGGAEKPSKLAGESNSTEVPGFPIKVEETSDSVKEGGQPRARRASSNKSKREHNHGNSASGLSRRKGKKRQSGVTFTFDHDSRWCSGLVSNNLVHPPQTTTIHGWEINCWKFSKEDFNVTFAVHKSEDRKAIIISKEGLYFLHSMLTFVLKDRSYCGEINRSIGYSVVKAEPDANLLRCVASTSCTADFRVSCYAGKVVRLKRHDRLSVKIQGDLDIVASVLTNPESTYVGLIKLHGK